MPVDPAISLSVSLFLGALLAGAAAHKAKAPLDFARIIDGYRVAPTQASVFLAVAVIICEFAIALSLLAPALRPVAGLAAAALFGGYGALIAFNILRGRTAIDCGCSFGAAADRIGPSLLARNAALVALSLIAAQPVAVRALGAFDYASSALAALAAAALYAAADVLRANAVRYNAMERAS